MYKTVNDLRKWNETFIVIKTFCKWIQSDKKIDERQNNISRYCHECLNAKWHTAE